jgi:N-methylhydantoinase A
VPADGRTQRVYPRGRFRIGIDVGGTFTDLVLHDQQTGAIAHHKLLSTPERPHVAPLNGVREILAQIGNQPGEVAFLGLGTTVMTNAFLERTGARTGLITTAGFRDLLEIARQQRPHTFDPFVSKAEPLVTRDLRVEVIERITAGGDVLTVLDSESLQAAIATLMGAGVEAVAICFLNSYANDVHERQAAAAVRERCPAAYVSVSADVLPEFREYERLSSTIVNTYLMPVASRYVRQFQSDIAALGVPHAPFVMNSAGGIMTPEQASERPIDTLFSGPSGGVTGAVHVSIAAGHRNIITFDMGGTSTDVCVIKNGDPQYSHTRTIDGIPLKATALDVHTVGAGGSSIASIDAGGMLRVGPESAGARPGPACYMQGGTNATTTDANVVLGRLNPEYLLGGSLAIDAKRSHAVIAERVAGPKRMTVVEAAAAIVALADTKMAHAVRFVSVERGLDPAEFVLVAFGGAGPVHAASVARQLGIRLVLVPPAPGVLCAMGVLVKDLKMDFSRTRVCSEVADDCSSVVDGVYRGLEDRARLAFRDLAANGAELQMKRSADARYQGQNHELTVPVPDGTFDRSALLRVKSAFHDAHREMFGYTSEDKKLELVTFRLTAILEVPRADVVRSADMRQSPHATPIAYRRVFFEEAGGFVECAVYDRGTLVPQQSLTGPAVVEQMDATTVVPPDFTARVDHLNNLILQHTAT